MSNSTHECLGKWRREREGERDLKLIEVYEHRLSINTNFSSKAGYASRINITIDAELGVVKVPGAVFSPSPPPRSSSCTRAWKCYQAFPLLWNPCFVHANDSKGRNCSWKLQIFIHFFAACISKDFEFLQHHVHILCTIVKTGCENLWKTWRMMMYDWKWYKVFLFFLPLFSLCVTRRFFWHWSFENLVFIEISLEESW